MTRLRGSGGKRVSKIKNCFSVLCHNKRDANTTLSFSFRWTSILIFQLFLVLLVVQPYAWAQLSNLSVDANGDSVFNGDTEKLQIVFTTSDSDDENRVYEYQVFVDHNGEQEIFSGAETHTGERLSGNQTVRLEWDGKLRGQSNTLPDGDYTLRVRLTISVDDPSLEDEEEQEDQVSELETVVTIDTMAEKPEISLGDVVFSPVISTLPVYYTLTEEVTEALLVIQRAAGGEPIGQSIALNTGEGSHTYFWNGKDANERVFEDGQYKLKIQITDNGGNKTESDLTEDITIDTEKPRITGIFINDTLPLVDDTYVSAHVQTISFNAYKGDGTSTELDLTGSDTEIVIKRVGGAVINGTLATSGTNKATFTFGNPLNELTENGEYEATVSISDIAGNLALSSARFTFDNAAPNLKTVGTNNGEFIPGSGVNGLVNYVEATLEDNFELNLDDSTIRLMDANGNALLGQQASFVDNKIRWQLFSPLLAREGLQDGRYTIEIVGADIAGNRTTPIPISFLYDNLAPELVSVKPARDGEPFSFLGDAVYYNLPLNQFVVTFDDGEFGTGVTYSGANDISSVVFGISNQDGSTTHISGRTFPDSANSVLTYILDTPLLKSDGSQDGNYVLNIKAADSLGNFEIHQFQFIYDTQVPTLTSTVPAANQTVSNLTEVVIRLNETTSGIDFVQSTFSLKRSVGEGQVEVPVDISSNGTDTATLTLLQPIASDGSDDGTYMIEVTPTDRTGNIGAAVRREFYLVSQTLPQIRLTTPETGTVNNISDITVEITNYIGSGINFDVSTITVMNTQGILVPQAEVEADAANNQLTWSTEAAIPRNGTADGEYTINATFVDFSGNQYTQNFPLILDTQFPSINTVEVGINPKQQLSLDTAISVTESFSQITVEFDGTDTDFDNTVVSLTGPDGNAIAVHRSNDGANLLTLNFQNLSILGAYTLTVTPSDIIGNVSETPFIYRFHLDIAVPVVTSVMIGGKSGAIVYVNGSAGEIVASIADTTGIGIAVGDGESRIVVTSSIGLPVPGTTTINAQNQLIWRPIALPDDGSADGQYTVAVTPVDNAGRTGDVALRAFIFDTQSPRITAATPITLHQPISYIGAGLVQFQLTVEDVGPALLELDDQTISLHNKSGEVVNGYITHDDTNQLFFTLPAPLPTDGSADGEYTLKVDLVDKASNIYQVKHDIIYDSQAPRLSSVNLNIETPLSLTPYQVTDLSDTINQLTLNFVELSQIDFVNTIISLIGPDGSAIPLTLENNGIDEVTVNFVTLTQGGLYTLSVTPQDKAGNVAQGAVPYLFRLEFEPPSLASVQANTVGESFELTSFQITDISDPINSFTLEFTDALRVDFENTGVTLSGPDGQEIPVTLVDTEDSKLMIRFVPLTQSGQYTLSVTPQDISGNAAQGAVQYPFRLEYEPLGIVSVKANAPDTTYDLIAYEIVEIGESINGFTLEFTDGDRVDFANTGIVLMGPNGQEISVSLEDSGDGVVLVRFVSIDQSGLYTLSVTPQDITGNVSQTTVQYPFRLEYEPLGIASVKANAPDTTYDLIAYEIVEIGESINGFTLEFTDGDRVDFANTGIVLMGPNGQEISVSLEDSGDGVVLVRFVSIDQSGLYTLSVTPQDITGNVSQTTVQYPFRLEYEPLGIASVKANAPDTTYDLIAYEIVEIGESINGFTLEFTDGDRVDFANTGIVLMGPNGQEISVSLEDSGDGVVLVRFVSIGQSGLYTLSVTPQDISGDVSQTTVQYPFRLKYEVSGIVSVKANTSDAAIDLIAYEIVEIGESINGFTLEFTDASRIDIENTSVTLTTPNGQEISVTLQENEQSQLMVRFIPLTQSGIYTLDVIPQDLAGNVAQQVSQYQFRLDTTLPSVSSVLIDGKRGSTVYVRNAIPRIVATITDSIDVGVAFGDNGSAIVVTNSQGMQVAGTTTSNGSNQMTWIPVPLPTDGTADGQYTVAVTPVDKVGRNGITVNRQFIYDTQVPRIISAAPLTLHAPVSYLSELSEFVLTIEDVGPADLVFASQVVALMDAAGKPVPAALTYDELAQQLYLTLNKPFASDGSVDGPYTLNTLLIDKAGNTLNARLSLIYDSKVPQVSSVQVNTPGTPTELVINEVSDLSETIDTITIQFSEATRIDFENTSVSLTDPDNLTIPLTQGDDGVSQLTLSFAELTKIGEYTLSVTPQDVAGNVAQSPIQFAFYLQFILPSVESVRIGDTVASGSGDIAYVNADNFEIVVNLLDPAGVGLSFDSLTGSDILVATLDNEIVPGSIATNGTDIMVWRPVTLSSDGSSDGRYAVYVYPVDKKGREGRTAYRELIYDTQEPEITDATPINLSQPVTYISESLTQFQFTVQDVGPADLSLEDQNISLRDQSGALIPTKLTSDKNNQLFLTLDEPLPLDGSRDGEYTVEIAFSDNAGNTLTIDHSIVYDTQAPIIVSTVPAHGAQLTEDVTQIQVVLDDKGDSGIDWSRTTVTLVNPDGVEISGELTSNGKTQITLTTNQLVADGMYLIRVQAVDRAGNGSQAVFEQSFLLSRLLPAVLSTSPSTAPIEDAYTNEEVDQIEVLLETADENHLSTIRLLNSKNQVVAGQQLRQSDKLIYKLVRPLATDGSEDGIYTIEFTPISATGRSGEAQQLFFTYDTQPPELVLKGIQPIVVEAQVNNSLTKIQLDLTDKVSGIDWENLDEDWVTFERLSPDPTEIPGKLSYVEGEQSYIIFSLKVPLADDGSNDGKYRVSVTPIDKAGNGDETYEEEFTYDTSPPVIDPNSLLINDIPLLTDIDAEDYPSSISTSGGVTIQASISDTGLGVNLSQSSIVIRNPNGQEITGTTRRNGVDTILFTSDGLNVEGNYQIIITAVGNDTEQLGFSPNDSITTEFLYETTDPTAVVTNDGGKTEFTDEELTLEGTAADPQGVRRAGPQGESEVPVPASGVWLVEIVGTGPDGQPIEPVLATDESGAQQQPWSRWSIDFLPARSGEYDIDIRVTDKAGNFAVYDVGEYTMSVSFSFNGNTFVYPNPVRHSKGDSAFISFDLNAAAEEKVKLILYIYDWGGDLVYSNTYTNIIPGERNDTQINWKLKNQAGTPVARGLYVFRLEAVNGAGNRANAVGKILVVD